MSVLCIARCSTALRGAARRMAGARPTKRWASIDADAALQTVSDARWAPVLQEIRDKAGGPGAVTALRRAVDKYGEAPDAAYASIFPFELDEYQIEALRHLRNDSNVIVSAPTGSGKTVAGELAIAYALAQDKRVLYTTPLKALSNQKFEDFCRFFGSENVGLSTGDSGVRRDAPVVVMTTEIYRNMLYEDTPSPFAVVFDEFHYMNDPSRGTVWEESVIASSESTKLVALSATVSNDEQLKGWMRKVHGPTEVVSSSFRPVPLKYEFACGVLRDVVPLFRAADVGPGSPREADDVKNGGARQRAKKRLRLNPLLEQVVDRNEAPRRRGRDRSRRKSNDRSRDRPPPSAMRCADVARDLQRRDLLPAIFFVFSRRGCEEEAKRVGSSLQLLTREEEVEARSIIQKWALDNEAVASLDSENERVQLLTRGVAAHHAGLLPQYKNLVEDLFKKGLVKACFATETLAAGVNLPARTTIITALRKRGDDGIEPLTTAGLLQMAGRAGRRGKDDAGTVLVMRGHRNGGGDADLARRILLAKVAPIESHFAPSYGMACSLLRRHAGSLERCQRLVERSFGSYLARRGVTKESDVDTYLKLVNEAQLRADAYERLFDDPRTPVDVLAREKASLREAQRDLLASPIAQLPPEKQKQVLETRRERKESRESPDWRSFVAITGVLKKFDAIDEDNTVTQLGALVASIKGDNELLLALALLDEATLEVAAEGSPDEFAALCSAFVSEVGSRPGAFVDYGPTPRVRRAVDELWRSVLQPLAEAQSDAGLGPDDGLHLRLDDSAAGLVEAWASGAVSWEQLSESTSLDHGDLIRLLRRTLDVLRTTAGLDAAILPEAFAPIRDVARRAAAAIDRPPVHDTTYDAIFVPDDEYLEDEDE
jgi:superfamily II RNA helicase